MARRGTKFFSFPDDGAWYPGRETRRADDGTIQVGVPIHDTPPPADPRPPPDDPMEAWAMGWLEQARLVQWERDQHALEKLEKRRKHGRGGKKTALSVQEENADRDKAIRDAHANIKALNPTESDWKIAGVLTERFPLSQRQIDRIVKKKK
jgi:hypothetical protein